MILNNECVVAITGATSGIGAALAVALAEYNVRLAICGRRKERLHTIAEEARAKGATVLELVANVSVPSQARGFVEQCIAHYGTIDVLVNNAGRGTYGSVEDTTQEMIDSMFTLNVFSLWHTTAAALPVMKRNKKGQIINIASVAGKQGFPCNSAYVAAKHAVVGFTAALRTELVDTGVEATVICPAGVSTEWADVTEGDSIGMLFGRGIKRSRSIAEQRGLPLAPLTKMMSAHDAAHIIVESILQPPHTDVFTHAGTEEQALLTAQNRSASEHQMLPFYLGVMQEYAERTNNKNNTSDT
ncbi:MAG: SDR family oxidoreductase [Candidatus Kapaibacterium sp.]|nr:SDR family oxidoreductase [Bacteroidota bacterium]